MHLVAFGRGEAVYEMDAREELNPLGVIQGRTASRRGANTEPLDRRLESPR